MDAGTLKAAMVRSYFVKIVIRHIHVMLFGAFYHVYSILSQEKNKTMTKR